MSYVKTTCDLGGIIQVSKHYPGNFGAPGMPRGRRKERTPEEIEKANQRNRTRTLQRIILANFREGRTVTLTYRPAERPETIEEAMEQRKRFMDRMRRACGKAGIPWKWIIVTERGKKGQVLHHHLIIEDRTDPVDILREVSRAWTFGRVQSTKMEMEDDMFMTLAEYLVKKETKGGRVKTYSRSRNLIVPEEKKEVIHARKWNREPRAPKGWYVVPESVWNAHTPEGWPVQRYTLRKMEDIVDNFKTGFRQRMSLYGRCSGGMRNEVLCGYLDKA